MDGWMDNILPHMAPSVFCITNCNMRVKEVLPSCEANKGSDDSKCMIKEKKKMTVSIF